MDFSTLPIALLKFPNLERFIFEYTSTDASSFRDFLPVIEHNDDACQSDPLSLQRHLKASFRALRLALMTRPIPALEMSIGWSQIDRNQTELAQDVFWNIEELHLHDSGLFETITKDVDTPSLRILRLTDFAILKFELLEAFCKKNCQHLRTLHLKRIWFTTGNHLQRNSLSLVHCFSNIGQTCSLQEVSACSLACGADLRLEMEELEALLLGRLEYSEAELIYHARQSSAPTFL